MNFPFNVFYTCSSALRSKQYSMFRTHVSLVGYVGRAIGLIFRVYDILLYIKRKKQWRTQVRVYRIITSFHPMAVFTTVFCWLNYYKCRFHELQKKKIKVILLLVLLYHIAIPRRMLKKISLLCLFFFIQL